MADTHPGLGLCFFGNQLFYAVNTPGSSNRLSRIGCVDFNFNVPEALLTGREDHFPGIQQAVEKLKERFGIRHIRILSFPTGECWSIFPKVVYDEADEREAHLKILMSGTDRQRIQPTWYNLSNPDYKLLMLRDTGALGGLPKIAPSASTVDLVSEFEIGQRWISHADPGGSFMTVCCFGECISVSSFILGKLRGTTFIEFDEVDDLPYLWLHHASEQKWMQGLHDHVYVYGQQAHRFIDVLRPFWDDAGSVQKMNSLEAIRIEADERTYGFDLEMAFPAILLSLQV
ncbi:MAG: hypothetical protein U5K31_07155 [Balneolaceae bacterium]|nr:hypothetical protein [Balneolaceae bacterium]